MTARKLFRGLSTNRMGTTSWTGGFGNSWIRMSVSLTPVLIGQRRRKGGITGKPLMNSGIRSNVWLEKEFCFIIMCFGLKSQEKVQDIE